MNPENKNQDKSLSVQRIQTSTEISFEYTPSDIVDLLLDNMKNYPLLWEYEYEPFNEDFYEAVEELCKIVNDKWSLYIDNLKMRRSINRILRFYCCLFPNTNVEKIDKFTNYYDKCATFLPASVNEIAYARCSHCYICYRNDFDLKRHLSEEHIYLQWPYQCAQCKESFRHDDEFELHKLLPHYDEIFRCKICNKSFELRNKYLRHVSAYHPKDRNAPGEFKCNVCGRSYHTKSSLSCHKLTHGEKKFKCHLCPKSYFYNALLTIHLKSHRKEFDYICEVCGKVFLLPSNLRQHMKKHTGAKVTCNICNLKLRRSSLNRHLRLIHVAYEGSVEATFRAKCYHYNRFTDQRTARPRRKVKVRKFSCKICKVFFENCKSMKEHNKEFHAEVKKVSCKMCSAEFSQKITLTSHCRKKHNLSAVQAFRLIYEKEDINVILNELSETQNVTDNTSDNLVETDTEILEESDAEIPDESDAEIPEGTDLLGDEDFNDTDKICISTIQDEIMEATDSMETQEIKIDYMNSLFTDLLNEPH